MIMGLRNVAKNSSTEVADLNQSYPFPQMPEIRTRLKYRTTIIVPKRGRIIFLLANITLKNIRVFESQEKVICPEIFALIREDDWIGNSLEEAYLYV